MQELKNGQLVRIKFHISPNRTEQITCPIKWFEKDRISLVFPEENQQLARMIKEGSEVEAVIYTDSGIFLLDSIVINSPLEHDFVIEYPYEKKKIQRREYVRAPLRLSIKICYDNETVKAKTINIGGGGVRFFHDEELKIDKLCSFSISLPDYTDIKGTAKFLYTLDHAKKYISVLVFKDISESDRNRIIKLCFEQEIKNKRLRKDSG